MNDIQILHNQPMLIDECSMEGLLNFPGFKASYAAAYEGYDLDIDTIEALKPLVQELKFTVVLGTWCGDSLRQVPPLLKVLAALEIDENNIRIVAVDLAKRTVNYPIADLHIERVPTVILYAHGIELGRIVETPIETFEKDIYYLLTNE